MDMAEIHPTIEDWRRLYELATRVRDLAPWDWMNEMDMIGVQDPESGEVNYVSVMGALGEHFAVSVYLGLSAFYRLLALEEASPEENAEYLLQIPQLMLSFEDRSELEKKDLEVIKSLGLKFRGRNAWPLFRAYRPGYAPWYLEAREARLVEAALEQLLEVAPRFEEDRSLVAPGEDMSMLIRVPEKSGAGLAWSEKRDKLPPPPEEPLKIKINRSLFSQLKELPRANLTLEADFFMLFSPIAERGQRPYFPFMLLIVDSKSGMILGQDLLRPEPTLEDMWGALPNKFFEQLLRQQMVPKEVKTYPGILSELIQLYAGDLQIRVKEVNKLRGLEEAKSAFLQFMG
jgi:hypothetical protein